MKNKETDDKNETIEGFGWKRGRLKMIVCEGSNVFLFFY